MFPIVYVYCSTLLVWQRLRAMCAGVVVVGGGVVVGGVTCVGVALLLWALCRLRSGAGTCLLHANLVIFYNLTGITCISLAILYYNPSNNRLRSACDTFYYPDTGLTGHKARFAFRVVLKIRRFICVRTIIYRAGTGLRFQI